MKALITGSAGHLGEALMRTLRSNGDNAIGIDQQPSDYTDVVASIVDVQQVQSCMAGVDVVFHTATLHKPHIATHSRQDFVDTNISGTLTLLDAAVAAGVGAFVFTSTTSVFGDALRPPAGRPAAWITESVTPVPKNIYGVTKLAAENLCLETHRNRGLSCVVLRTSRFFPESDDDPDRRAAFADANSKANEFLYRRVDLADVVSAHLCAAKRAGDLGFGRYIVSATTPLTEQDLPRLNQDASPVIAQRAPDYAKIYQQLGWRMFPQIDRVYVNTAARQALDWQPLYDYRAVLQALQGGLPVGSDLARAVGSKRYHAQSFTDGPYPVVDCS